MIPNSNYNDHKEHRDSYGDEKEIPLPRCRIVSARRRHLLVSGELPLDEYIIEFQRKKTLGPLGWHSRSSIATEILSRQLLASAKSDSAYYPLDGLEPPWFNIRFGIVLNLPPLGLLPQVLRRQRRLLPNRARMDKKSPSYCRPTSEHLS